MDIVKQSNKGRTHNNHISSWPLVLVGSKGDGLQNEVLLDWPYFYITINYGGLAICGATGTYLLSP